MSRRRNSNKYHAQKGATLVEFALVSLVLLGVIFTSFEIDRLLLTYTTLANAASGAVRYAAVNGYYANGQNNYTSTNTDAIKTVAKTLATTGILDSSTVNTTVTYPDTTNNVGSQVSVTVTVPYAPFTNFFPISVTLGSTAVATICY